MKNKNSRLRLALIITTLGVLTSLLPTISWAATPQTADFQPNIDFNLWGNYGIGAVNGFE